MSKIKNRLTEEQKRKKIIEFNKGKILVSVAIPLRVNSFDYYIPTELIKDIRLGTLVIVDVRNNKFLGVITRFITESKYKLKPVLDIYENIQVEKEFVDFLKWISSYYSLHEGKILEFMLPIKLKKLAKVNHPLRKEKFVKKTNAFDLTRALNSFNRFTQKEVVQYIDDKKKISIRELKEKFKTRVKTVIPKLLEKGFIKESEVTVYKEHDQYLEPSRFANIRVTEKQKTIINDIYPYIKDKKYMTYLIDGVTGSGKTEVYYQIVKKTLELNKTVLILLPEIALTDQTISYFLDLVDFSEIAIIHSHLTPSQKSDYWYRIALKRIKLVIGARSAIFAPLKEIGLIIVDEEQDSSYKQSETSFRYNARDLAVVKGFQNSIPVVLGTATPSLETKLNVINEKYKVGYLPDRINDMPLPEIRLIDLKEKDNLVRDPSTKELTLISIELKELIEEKLAKKEQIIIYLNKRGYHSNLLCKECGYSFKCENCDISYTYYKYQNVLKCHYCEAMKTKIEICPECGGHDLTNLSIGTEKITEELENLFPEAQIDRFDRDLVKTHKSLSDTIKRMKKKEIDILIGTQMVVKGHHFPNVTLVALLVADQGLHYPGIRSVERTFQDLIQVSGRAGRADKKGIVVLQAYNTTHYAIQYFINNEFSEFWDYELEWRKALDHPPFFKIVKIILSSKNRELLEGEIMRINQYKPITSNYTPAKKAPVYKIKNVFRYIIEISSESPQNVMKELRSIYNFIEKLKISQNVRMIIDRDPL